MMDSISEFSGTQPTRTLSAVSRSNVPRCIDMYVSAFLFTAWRVGCSAGGCWRCLTHRAAAPSPAGAEAHPI